MNPIGRIDVEGVALLNDVVALLRRYVVLNAHAAIAVALWVVHTHAMEAAETTPYLHITSPEKRSGKSRLLEVLSLLVARPWPTSRVTASVLMRKLAKGMPTLLLDESDAAFGGEREYREALRALLDAGWRRGGAATISVKKRGDWEPQDFPVFGPKAIAGIGKLPDTVADRSIPIVLKRRAPNEKVERFRWREASEAAGPLRERLEQWPSANLETLTEARPQIPTGLDDRATDGWEPLLAIADAIGGDWPQRARRAALALSTGEERDSESLGVRLLCDIRRVFQERATDRLTSEELVKALGAMEEAPWGDLGGKPLDTRMLAARLKPYGVKPGTIRVGNEEKPTLKGYYASSLSDAWRRYVPQEPSQASQASQAPDSDVADVTAVTDVTDRVEPSINTTPWDTSRAPDSQ